MSGGGMREIIARVIDPEAFDVPGDLVSPRRKIALDKAEQIIALDFSFDELPPELQDCVGAVESELTAASLLTFAAAASLPKLNEEGNGAPIFTGLIKPLDGEGLYVAVLLDEAAALGGTARAWVGRKMVGDEAQHLAAEIVVAAAGGGRA